MFACLCRYSAVAAAGIAAGLIVTAWFDATTAGVRVGSPVYSVGALLVLLLLFPAIDRWVVCATVRHELAEAYVHNVRATDRRAEVLREELVATLGTLVVQKVNEGAASVTDAVKQNTEAVVRQMIISQMPGREAASVAGGGGKVVHITQSRGT